MPTPALPQQEPTPLAGAVRYRRQYRDAAGRAFTGKVTLTGSTRTDAKGVVIVPAPIPFDVVDGVLDVWLQPDTYTVAAELRTAEGVKVTDRETVTLELA